MHGKGLQGKDLLGIGEMSAAEISLVLDTALSMKEVLGREIPRVPALRGKAVATLFYEPSTRTRVSFELAAKHMGADTINIATSASSVQKGETLVDTARTLEEMGVDLVVLRHGAAGAPEFLARCLRASVVNAGDGAHEHPTQALLDLFTVREKKGRLEGLMVAIVGDIAYSRVARSGILAFRKMGARVRVAGPPTLLPPGLEEMGAEVAPSLEEALAGADVVMALRLQRERQAQGLLPSWREYKKIWGLDSERLDRAAPGALLMHPGPVKRGVELSGEAADGPRSVIGEQVTNGVAVRMAVLYLLLGGGGERGLAD